MERCSKCGTKIRGQVLWTPTGAKVCASCHGQVVAVAVGVKNGSIADAVVLGAETPTGTTGVLAWIRKALGRT